MSCVLSFKNLIAAALLVNGVQAFACEIKEENPKLVSIAVSGKANQAGFVVTKEAQSANTGLYISKCKGGYLQLAQGIVLPAPDDYSGLTFLRKDLKKSFQCEVKDENLNFDRNIENQLRIGFQCMGLMVEGQKGLSLNILDNKQCRIVGTDPANGRILLHGDNCILEANQENYTVSPAVLPSCFQGLSDLTKLTKEVDLNLSVIHKMSLDENVAHEELAVKPVRLTVSENPALNKEIAKSRLAAKSFDLFKSADYNLKVGFGELILVGTPDTGVQAKARYFIDNTGSASENAYRVPFVMKNELYLVKKNEEPLLIGNWFSGSVVSSQWKGLDGDPSFNKLFQGPVYANLTAGAKQIQKGDKLVLSSKLQSPNSGPKRLAKYMADLLIKLKKIKTEKVVISTTSINGQGALDELPGIEGLEGISSIEELKGFSDLALFEKSVLRDWSKQWPVTFRNICVNSHCGKLDDLNESFVMETMYEVESDAFELKIKPLRQIEKWNEQMFLDRNQNIENQVKCF